MKQNDLKIVVVGRNGQVAWELQRALAPLGHLTSIGRPELDLARPESIRGSIRQLQPQILINAAAYTTVDQAESEPDVALTINAEGQRELAEEAKQLGALFITYSSDYVFSGEKEAPYLEIDDPKPVNAYGASKLAGDQAVEAVGGKYLIFRTSWVYGTRGNNFLNTILRLACEREELRIVDDQIGAPTWSRDIAISTAKVIRALVADTPATTSVAECLGTRSGIYNMTADGSVSWFGFAQAIVDEAQKYAARGMQLARLVPIDSLQYSLPARRPKNSRLDNEKLKRVFGVNLPAWQDSLSNVIQEVMNQQPGPSAGRSPVVMSTQS